MDKIRHITMILFFQSLRLLHSLFSFYHLTLRVYVRSWGRKKVQRDEYAKPWMQSGPSMLLVLINWLYIQLASRAELLLPLLSLFTKLLSKENFNDYPKIDFFFIFLFLFFPFFFQRNRKVFPKEFSINICHGEKRTMGDDHWKG